MKRKFLGIIAAVLLIAALLATPASAATIGGGTVTSYNVHLRTEMDASNNYNILFDLPKGSFVLVEEILNGWYKVVCNGIEGYVPSDSVYYTYAAEGKYTFSAVTGGSSVNMRAGASTNMPVVKTLGSAGTALTITGVCGDWLHVTDAAGDSGYIRCDLAGYKQGQNTQTATTTTAPAATYTAPAVTYSAPAATTYSAPAAVTSYSGTGANMAQTAQLYVGYRYVWGGMSPATGFDCSGFVNYICKQYGISLHRVAQDIYSYDGVFVTAADMQPGDILCFGYGPYSVGHVGMYIGNGQMVHACDSSTGVIYSTVTSGYYSTNLVGVKRVTG